MIIKKLELLNFQVIEKFAAEFDGTVYFVTGDNELGKSTLLKAIGALLTGQRDDVLRTGATKGFAKMIVGGDGEEFDVSLSFTEANPRGTLTIKQASTGMQTNNVSMLQRIFGYQDFDAVEFSRWSETAEGRRKQVAVIKGLLPAPVRERIDTIDAEVEKFKAERIGVNRDVKTFDTLVAQIAERLEPGDVEKYAAPVDITELMAKQETNAKLIEKAKTVRATLKQRTEQLEAIPARYKEAEDAMKNAQDILTRRAEEAKAAYEKEMAAIKEKTAECEKEFAAKVAQIDADKADLEARKANCHKWLNEYEANNPEKSNVSAMLLEAEAHNKKFSLVEQYKEKAAQLEDARQKAETLDANIVNLAVERRELIAGAELPIAGLSFTDEGLELNGVPFVPGKVSDSQIMEIAAKLVIASNPTVKVFRIARGESLGAKRLETIIDIAKRNGYQGFIENVVRGQEEMRIEEYTEPK